MPGLKGYRFVWLVNVSVIPALLVCRDWRHSGPFHHWPLRWPTWSGWGDYSFVHNSVYFCSCSQWILLSWLILADVLMEGKFQLWGFGSHMWTVHGCAWVLVGPLCARKDTASSVPLELGSLLTGLSYFSLISITTAATLFFLKNSSEHLTSLYRNSHGSQMFLMLKHFQNPAPLIFPTWFPLLALCALSTSAYLASPFILFEGLAHVLLLLLIVSLPLLPHRRFLILPAGSHL